MPRAPVNGTDLYYERHGTGPALLFHDGYNGSHDAWEDVVPAFSDRYQCIVMDPRGAGDSAHPTGPHTIAQFAADVVAMADHLGVERFTYIGHSMGGAIGYELGLSYAWRLDRLVIVAPAPADGLRNGPGIDDHRERDRRLRDAKDRETMVRESIAFAARPNVTFFRRSVERQLSSSQEHFEGAWQSMLDYSAGARLQEITVPTLLMAGAADALLPYNLADFQRLGNATLHVFSRVGHGMEYEAPDEFNRVLADFLEHGVVTARTLREAHAAAFPAAP